MMQVKEKVPKDSQKSRRRKYSDGIKGHSEKLSSVNRTMIIGIMPSAQEFHDNLSVIFKILELSKIPDCSISADLKLELDCCGKGSASSKHPCPICDICMNSVIRSVPKLYFLSCPEYLSLAYRETTPSYFLYKLPPVSA